MITDFDPQKVSSIIREAAINEILPFFRKLRGSQISDKGSGEIVTEADMRAEKRLTRELLTLLPGSLTIGEEAVGVDPMIEKRILSKKPVWVIDPVDGTRNFSKGKECFCVIIALCLGGETIAGWIYDPISEVMYYTELGEGAFANGRRLKIPKSPIQNKMTASLSKFRQDQLSKKISDKDLPKKMLRYRCIGHEYIDIALGKLHFGEYTILKPWDHAAGLLLISEAGGYHAYLNTETPYKPTTTIKKELLVTTSEAVWHQLKKLCY